MCDNKKISVIENIPTKQNCGCGCLGRQNPAELDEKNTEIETCKEC